MVRCWRTPCGDLLFFLHVRSGYHMENRKHRPKGRCSRLNSLKFVLLFAPQKSDLSLASTTVPPHYFVLSQHFLSHNLHSGFLPLQVIFPNGTFEFLNE